MAICELDPSEFYRRNPSLARAVLGDCEGELRWYEAHVKIDAPMYQEGRIGPWELDTSGYRCQRHLKLLLATRLSTRPAS